MSAKQRLLEALDSLSESEIKELLEWWFNKAQGSKKAGGEMR